jgi:hypothetical protein
VRPASAKILSFVKSIVWLLSLGNQSSSMNLHVAAASEKSFALHLN